MADDAPGQAEGLAEKIKQILLSSGMEGAVFIVYRDTRIPHGKDEDPISYSYAAHGMTDQYAIGSMMAAMGEKMASASILNGELKKRPPIDGVENMGEHES